MSDPLAEYRAGSLEPWTVDILTAVVRAKRPHVLIETGTFEAKTTLALVGAMEYYAALHGSLLYTVESDPDRAAKAAAIVDAHRVPVQGIGVQVVHGDALGWLQSLGDGSVDFVFLDDDHTALHVAHEIIGAKRILSPGGICFVHDVIGPFGLAAVVKAAGGQVWDLARLHSGGGLGVIVK